MSNNVEERMEGWLFKSRWLLAPFYGGLVAGIVILLIKFVQEFISFIPKILDAKLNEIMMQLLILVDLTLLSNLLLIIVFSGYETFVSKINNLEHEDRPSWMGHVDFSQLKIKLFGSIVAISGIELLKAFMLLDNYTDRELAWLVGIHLTFIASGLLFAIMDKIAASAKKTEVEAHIVETKVNTEHTITHQSAAQERIKDQFL